jgi:hypothetical protein
VIIILPVRSDVLLLASVVTDNVVLPLPDSDDSFIHDSFVLAVQRSCSFEVWSFSGLVSPVSLKFNEDGETERLPPFCVTTTDSELSLEINVIVPVRVDELLLASMASVRVASPLPDSGVIFSQVSLTAAVHVNGVTNFNTFVSPLSLISNIEGVTDMLPPACTTVTDADLLSDTNFTTPVRLLPDELALTVIFTAALPFPLAVDSSIHEALA